MSISITVKQQNKRVASLVGLRFHGKNPYHNPTDAFTIIGNYLSAQGYGISVDNCRYDDNIRQADCIIIKYDSENSFQTYGDGKGVGGDFCQNVATSICEAFFKFMEENHGRTR